MIVKVEYILKQLPKSQRLHDVCQTNKHGIIVFAFDRRGKTYSYTGTVLKDGSVRLEVAK